MSHPCPSHVVLRCGLQLLLNMDFYVMSWEFIQTPNATRWWKPLSGELEDLPSLPALAGFCLVAPLKVDLLLRTTQTNTGKVGCALPECLRI